MLPVRVVMITPYAYLGPCLKGTALELHRRYGTTNH